MPTFKWRWWPFHRYSSCGAKRQGKLDGKRNIPAWEAPDQPPYVLELVEAAEHNIRLLTEEWHARDKALAKKMEEAEKLKDSSKNEVDEAQRNFDNVSKEYEDQYGSPPPVGTNVRIVLYWAFLIFLCIFEFPMNAIVFRIFEEAEVFTYVVTAAIAIALVGCAHFLGLFLREGRWDKTRIVFTIVLIIAPMLVIRAVAWFRQLYLSRVSEEAGEAWSREMFFAFATFNLIIFIVATVASYLAHNPLLSAVHRARRQLAKALRKYTRAEIRYSSVETERKKTKNIYSTKVRQIKDTAQILIQLYRTENLRHRTDRKEFERKGLFQPESFKMENQPIIRIPEELS